MKPSKSFQTIFSLLYCWFYFCIHIGADIIEPKYRCMPECGSCVRSSFPIHCQAAKARIKLSADGPLSFELHLADACGTLVAQHPLDSQILRFE